MKLANRLKPSGKTRVRVFTRSAKGVRRVTVRTYENCERTSTRTRRLKQR